MDALVQLSRIICRHGWRDAAEWARSIETLADLSDDEIDTLFQIEASGPEPVSHG